MVIAFLCVFLIKTYVRKSDVNFLPGLDLIYDFLMRLLHIESAHGELFVLVVGAVLYVLPWIVAFIFLFRKLEAKYPLKSKASRKRRKKQEKYKDLDL